MSVDRENVVAGANARPVRRRVDQRRVGYNQAVFGVLFVAFRLEPDHDAHPVKLLHQVGLEQGGVLRVDVRRIVVQLADDP